MDFKRNLSTHLQQDVLRLTEEDLTPLLLLETVFHKEHDTLPGVHTNTNNDLRILGIKARSTEVSLSPLALGVLTSTERKIELVNLVLCVLQLCTKRGHEDARHSMKEQALALELKITKISRTTLSTHSTCIFQHISFRLLLFCDLGKSRIMKEGIKKK